MRARANRPGTVSLGLGIVAIASAVFVVGGAVGLVGLAFGIVGLVRVHRGQATNLRAAAAGTVLSGISLLASLGLVLQVASLPSRNPGCVAGRTCAPAPSP